MLHIPNFMVPIPPTSIAVSSTYTSYVKKLIEGNLMLISCSSCAHLCSSCAHLVLRGAKLSVVKKRRRKVLEEVSINIPIIAHNYHMYFIIYVQ